MTEIVRTTTTPLGDRMTYAKALAEANLLPAAYRKQPANVLLAMEYADALGLSPIAAIQGVHVIDGKPTASAQLIGALVRKAGHRLRVQVADDGTAARATIIRRDDPEFEFVSVWTLDRAQAAGLTGKGTWKQYPTNLLKARAITEVARDACPEVLSGVAYTAEELGHDDEPVDWTPATTTTVEVVQEEPVRKGGRTQAPATDKQRAYIGRFVREIGYPNTAAFLESPDAQTILGSLGLDDHGVYVTPDTLTRVQASALIGAFTRFDREVPDEHDAPIVDAHEVPDEDTGGEDYEAHR
jgi:hypothetical protein